MEFPIYSTKRPNVTQTFDLNTPGGRHEYFQAKVGPEIERIKTYLDNNTFVAFLVAKKSAGKGTYTKLFEEQVGKDRMVLISIGDLIRNLHQVLESESKEKEELVNYLKTNYRGFKSIEESLDKVINRSTSKVDIPSELILALLKREIEKHPNKAIFVDGFPRTMDQISYSLFFRQIMNLRDDPDFFIAIDVPNTVIDERMKYRVVCPKCQTSRNLKLLPTEFVGYDKEKDEYYLICDNHECDGRGETRMVQKEGDEFGIEHIKGRLENDQKLVELTSTLHGIPTVKVRNHIPESEADKFDQYELTPEFYYEQDSKPGNILTKGRNWTIKDDNGVVGYSLMAPAATISMIAQIDELLN